MKGEILKRADFLLTLGLFDLNYPKYMKKFRLNTPRVRKKSALLELSPFTCVYDGKSSNDL